MELTEIISAISTASFPVVIAVYALYMGYKQQERHEQRMSDVVTDFSNRIDTIINSHRNETNETVSALSELKVVIVELTTYLKDGDKHG